MPNVITYGTCKMALLFVLYILLDAQFILAGANTGILFTVSTLFRSGGPHKSLS